MTYRLIDRFFSRDWRRNKRYSEHELRWLARKRKLAVRLKRDVLEVYHPVTGAVIAHFKGAEASAPTTAFGKFASAKI